MKDIGEGTIRRIDWTELTPVVLLLRVFKVALRTRVIVLALIGFWLTVLIGSFSIPPYLQNEAKINHLLTEASCFANGFPSSYRSVDCSRLYGVVEAAPPVLMWGLFCDIPKPYFICSVRECPRLLLWLPGVILTWAFCGGMICRVVTIRLTVNESESTGNLLRFIRKRGTGFFSSLIILSLGILCCYLPVKIAYWLMAVPGWDIVVTLLFPIPLLFVFFMVILTLGLAAGWMLLFAAVSTDGSDGFDAISRMFSYIFQRPLHYILYWLCSGILGWLGFLLVWFICDTVAGLGEELILFSASGVNRETFASSFWIGLIRSIPIAYSFAWFWTSSVAIYLLLRRSVDATPFCEVYRVATPKVQTLPTIKQDERGAPEVKKTETLAAEPKV